MRASENPPRPSENPPRPSETTVTIGVTADGPADDTVFTGPGGRAEDTLGALAADRARVAIVMGSQSDWATMRHAADMLTALEVPHETLIVSAHRTPRRLYEFASGAEERGLKVIVAGAGGAAHLPGMVASLTTLPVFGVPVESKALSGWDSLLSIVQMPAGVPVGTLAIGRAGAVNAALLAASVLALSDDLLSARVAAWRELDTARVAEHPVDEVAPIPGVPDPGAGTGA